MGIKDPTLGTLPPIHKERIFFSYALEISQCRNLKNLSKLGVKSVQNHLRALVSHTTYNGQRDAHLQYTLSGLPLNGAKPLPMIRKVLSQISKWADGRDEALLITTSILRSLEARSSLGGPSS